MKKNNRKRVSKTDLLHNSLKLIEQCGFYRVTNTKSKRNLRKTKK